MLLAALLISAVAGFGCSATAPARSGRSAQGLGQAPLIDLWYGNTINAGTLGMGQRQINIIGNVSGADGVAGMTYALNGGDPIQVPLGPDGIRLIADGDFNVEIDSQSLPEGVNTVELVATSTSGATSSATVTINMTTGTVWPLPYSTDWSTISTPEEIQQVATVVDGKWEVTPEGLHNLTTGYDRLIVIGDQTWAPAYEATVTVTVHWFGDWGGIGPAVGWQGHTGEDNPQTGWPVGGFGWVRNKVPTPQLEILTYDQGTRESTPRSLTEGETYTFKIRVEPIPDDPARMRVSVKLWNVKDPEPAGWDLSDAQLQYRPGSLLLVAHSAEVTWRSVDIVPISVNFPPAFTSFPPTFGSPGQPYLYSVTAADANADDTLTITAPVLPSWLTLVDHGDGTATLSGTPSETVSGPQWVTLRVMDPVGMAADQQFVIAMGSTGIVSDDFSPETTLGSQWRFLDPRGDSTVTLNGTNAFISVPAGVSHDLWPNQNHAPRILQAASNSDFGIEAKFESVPVSAYQMQGLVVQETDDNLLRFGSYSDGTGMRLFAAHINGGSVAVFANVTAAVFPAFLRVVRSGDTWAYTYSEDGSTWHQAAYFYRQLIVTEVGAYAGNAGSNQAHTASLDYFMNLANPIEDTDVFPLAPTIDSTPVLAVNVGDTYTYDVVASDRNGDPLTFAGTTLPAWLTLTDNGAGTARLTGIPTAAGSYPVVISVSDPGGLSAEQSFTIRVRDVVNNQAPSFTSTPPTSALAGYAFRYSVTTADPDGDAVAISAGQPLPAWLTLVDNQDGTATLSGTAVLGTYPVELVVSDGLATATQSFTINVTDQLPDSGIVSDDFAPETSLGTPWRFVDPRGDCGLIATGSNVLIDVAGGSPHDLWGSNPGAPRILQAATNTSFGIQAKFESQPQQSYQMQGLVVQETDNTLLRFGLYHNGSGLRLFAARIVAGASTSLATVVPPAGVIPTHLRVLRTGDSWTYSYSEDGQSWVDVLTTSQVLNVTEVGVYAGNAGANPAYTASVDYFMSLASPIVDNDTFIPPPANSAPSFTSSPVATATAGTTYSYGATAADPDTGDTLTISAVTVPGWLTLTDHGDGTAALTGTPGEGDVGSHSVLLRVTDSSGAVGEQSFSISVESAGTGGGGGGGIVSDDFGPETTLGAQWRFLNPLGDATLVTDGANALIGLPAGTPHDLWGGKSHAPRLLQSAPDTDFGIEVKFESVPALSYQMQGLVVQEADDNLLRLGVYSNGNNLTLFAARIVGNSSTVLASMGLPAGVTVPYLRVVRTGDTWTYRYSTDGTTWVDVVTTTQVMNVTEVGAYVGNAGGSPAYTGSIDYFMSLADPIVDTDGSGG